MAEKDLKEWLGAVSGQGINIPDSQRAYREWASTYEKDAEKFGFTSSYVKVALILKDMFPENQRRNLRILDVGAGTGLVAKQLKRYGFLHIDALDPSETMLNEARKDDLYENYFEEFITRSPSSIPADSYDVLTGSGIYADEAHVPCDALYEMIRLVKPGGLIVLVGNLDILRSSKNYTDLEPLMGRLEGDGMWKNVSRETWKAESTGSNEVERVAWCYRVL